MKVHVHDNGQDVGLRTVEREYAIGNFGGVVVKVKGQRYRLIPDSFRAPDGLAVVHLTGGGYNCGHADCN